MVTKADIIEGARRVLLGNRRVGVSPWGQRYAYVCPSPRSYPYQWFWDSCFHAIALSHLEPDMAKEELLSLLSVQDASGFIPHVIFWERPRIAKYWGYLQSLPSFRPRHTALIQPPFLAQAVEAVYQHSQDADFLRRVLPGVRSYYRWLARNRDPDGDGLISIITPYESGLDHSPAYEVALGRRPSRRGGLTLPWRRLDLYNFRHRYNSQLLLAADHFSVEDVLVNCAYAQGLHAIARLSAVLGETEEVRHFRARAEWTETAILHKCYDAQDGLFYSLYSHRELKARVKTVASLAPVVLEGITDHVLRRLLSEHLLNREQFWLPYPVPSVAASEPSFNPEPIGRLWAPHLWRGPTWVNTNWLIVKGLWKHDYQEAAGVIARRTVEMVQRSGFREYYNPHTGEGYGARDFGWSTLVVDMLEEAGLDGGGASPAVAAP